MTFPFRAYTLIALPFYLTLGKAGDFASEVMIGYFLSGLFLLVNAAIEKFAERDGAKAKIDFQFACVAFIGVVFMLPATAPLHV